MTVCGTCSYHALYIHQSVYHAAVTLDPPYWGICLQRIPEVFVGLVAEERLLGDPSVERRADETCGCWRARPVPHPRR